MIGVFLFFTIFPRKWPSQDHGLNPRNFRDSQLIHNLLIRYQSCHACRVFNPAQWPYPWYNRHLPGRAWWIGDLGRVKHLQTCNIMLRGVKKKRYPISANIYVLFKESNTNTKKKKCKIQVLCTSIYACVDPIYSFRAVDELQLHCEGWPILHETSNPNKRSTKPCCSSPVSAKVWTAQSPPSSFPLFSG